MTTLSHWPIFNTLSKKHCGEFQGGDSRVQARGPAEREVWEAAHASGPGSLSTFSANSLLTQTELSSHYPPLNYGFLHLSPPCSFEAPCPLIATTLSTGHDCCVLSECLQNDYNNSHSFFFTGPKITRGYLTVIVADSSQILSEAFSTPTHSTLLYCPRQDRH